MNEPQNISLSLISHTNEGKTTLARALLKKNVGEIEDDPHTTQECKAYEMVVTENGDKLILWDNPGFSGGLEKIINRLSSGRIPLITWLQENVVDRHFDLPLYCSRQAVNNIIDHADVTLYLVDAQKWPENCDDLEDQINVLKATGKPVLVILNRTGNPVEHGHANRYVTRWETYFQDHDIPKERIFPLDALTRFWTQEGLLLEKVRDLVDEKKQPSAVRLLDAWHRREKKIMEDSLATIGEFLAEAARYKLKNEGTFWDSIKPFGRPNPARKEMEEWIAARCEEVIDNLLELAMIDGKEIPLELAEPITEIFDWWWPISLFFGDSYFRLGNEALTQLTRFIFAFYIEASHFTRGQGDWPKKKVNSEAELLENWRWYKEVTRVLEPRENELNRLWDRLRKGDKKTSEDLSVLYQPLLNLLAERYPDSDHFIPGAIPKTSEEDAACEPDEESE